MGNIAFLFPGQGSQYVGMCQDLYKDHQFVRDIFDRANDLLQYNIEDIIFNGPEEALKQTHVTQPAIFLASIACMEVLKSNDIVPQIVAGHSVGEYTALVACGCLTFDDSLRLLNKRAQYIQEASEANKGTMAAIIGLSKDDVIAICKDSSEHGVVEAVNFNSPQQTVISGDIAACEEAIKKAIAKGAKKAVLLNVSGPFHSSTLMKQAADRLEDAFDGISINSLTIPFADNVTGDIIHDNTHIKELLVKQIYSPVQWVTSMQNIIARNINTYIEVGPGKVLSGLMKRIDKSVKMLHMEDKSSLDKILSQLKCSNHA